LDPAGKICKNTWSNNGNLSLQNLNSGVYYLQLILEDGTVVIKR